MRGWIGLRGLMILGLLLPLLGGCGGDSNSPLIVEPGLIGIDNRPSVSLTAPELTVEYTLPGFGNFVVKLLSDQSTDGDIAFDPVLGTFTIAQGPETLLFGIDSLDENESEYRAFLDFPLDDIPLNATIHSATLTVFVNFVDFAATVPVLLDLVRYSVAGLIPADYDVPPLAFRAFNIFHTDVSQDVEIDVTPLMAEAQRLGLADLQLRFLLGL